MKSGCVCVHDARVFHDKHNNSPSYHLLLLLLFSVHPVWCDSLLGEAIKLPTEKPTHAPLFDQKRVRQCYILAPVSFLRQAQYSKRSEHDILNIDSACNITNLFGIIDLASNIAELNPRLIQIGLIPPFGPSGYTNDILKLRWTIVRVSFSVWISGSLITLIQAKNYFSLLIKFVFPASKLISHNFKAF